jgi:hypothetical protein
MILTAREAGRDGAGQRAAGSVMVAGVDPRSSEFASGGLGARQHVHHLRARQMSAFGKDPHVEIAGESEAAW